MLRTRDQKLGTNVRKSFSRMTDILEMPNLIEIQKKSFKWFLDKGMREVLKDVSPIVDYSGNMIVLRTFPGLASAVAAGIDAIHMTEILGCVAGDDTIIIVIREDASAAEIGDKIKSMIRSI